MEKLVAIIILNWNGFDVTKECISSLLDMNYQNVSIIIVDNASKDDSVNRLLEIYNDRRISYLPLDKNYGFTGGNNRGIEYARTTFKPDYYLLLNNDTVVEKDLLSKLLNAFKIDTNCYASVPKIFYYDNPDIIWFAGGSVSRITGRVTQFGQHKKDSAALSVSKPTGFMNGCCAMLPKETIENIGVLDDIFFANSEDTDYSLRILDSKHTIQYVADAIIYHKVNYSFKANKGKWLAFYLATRGIVLLQKKHLPAIVLPIFYLVFSVRWVIYLTVKLIFLRDFKSIIGIYEGLADGVTNRLRFVSNT